MALQAINLSTMRAGEVRHQPPKRYPTVDPGRVEMIGRGWEEPAGKDSEQNRRVEVQWFTVE